jgi:serine protease DegQ
VAHHILDQIIEHGSVQRGWLGLEPQDITPDLARAFHLKQAAGVIVARVLRGGPADAAGIQVGDIIQALDGRPVADAVDLLNRLAPMKPGASVKLRILRAGREIEREVKVSLRPAPRRR